MRMRDNCSVLQLHACDCGHVRRKSALLYELPACTPFFFVFHKILSSCNLPLFLFSPSVIVIFYIDRHGPGNSVLLLLFYRIFLPADLHINLLIWDLNPIFIKSVFDFFGDPPFCRTIIPAVLPGIHPRITPGLQDFQRPLRSSLLSEWPHPSAK